MTSALLTQVAAEVVRSPDAAPQLFQLAVETLRTDPKPALLDQIAVEVISLNVPGNTPIAGEIPVSLAATATLKLGTALSGEAPVALTATANIQTGTHLSATALLEATPRGRLSGAAATPGAGNFFLLF